MTLTLYTNPMSRGRIARWMLEEVGRPYAVEIVDWAAKSDAFLALNPLGKVPTLVHDGTVVTEAAAICLHMADAFPDAALAPPPGDPARGAYYRWTLFAAGPVEQAVTAKALGLLPPAEKRGMVGFGSFDDTVDVLEGAAAGASPWLLGERFSAADVYVGSQILWGLMFGTLPKRPAFDAYGGRLTARDAYRRAAALDDAAAASGAAADPALLDQTPKYDGECVGTQKKARRMLRRAFLFSPIAETIRGCP